MLSYCAYLFRVVGLASVVAALVVFLALAPRGASANTEKRVALVIGNGDYKAAPQLDNPPVDARAVAAKLKQLGFQVIEGYDLNISQMRQSVHDFSEALPESKAAIVYYAGHGVSVDEENWILPTDIVLKSPDDLDLGAISVTQLLKRMKREERFNVVILDACRDNPFAAALAKSKSRSVVAERGFSRIDDKLASGTLIAFATDPGSTAQDGPAGEHSPFTKALLDHLEDPGVTIGSVMDRVRDEVHATTQAKQTPWVSTSILGEFYLNPVAAPAKSDGASRSVDSPAQIAIAPEPGKQAEENLLWESAQHSNLADDYQAYLDAYPNGIFAKMARNRVAALSNAPAPSSATIARADPRAISVEAAAPLPGADKNAPAAETVAVAEPQAASVESPAQAPPPSFRLEIGTMDLEKSLGLSAAEHRELQLRLAALNFNAGPPNGEFGDRTRSAIADWQRKTGVRPTGWLGPLQFAELRAESESAYQRLLAAPPRIPAQPLGAAQKWSPPPQKWAAPPVRKPQYQARERAPSSEPAKAAAPADVFTGTRCQPGMHDISAPGVNGYRCIMN